MRALAQRATGAATVTDPVARARISALHDEFRQACAESFEKHLGSERALSSLTALASAPVQRYLVARQTMAPVLTKQLLALKQRMGNIEI